MAVTLDATLGGATSNSYVDMTAALAIAENIPGGGDWAALDEEVRNLSLIVATRWLETLSYAGDRCQSTQRLKWPRSGASCDGVTNYDICRAPAGALQISNPGSRSNPGDQLLHRSGQIPRQW